MHRMRRRVKCVFNVHGMCIHPGALPQESPDPSRDMPGALTTLCCVRPACAGSMVYAARRSEVAGVIVRCENKRALKPSTSYSTRGVIRIS